MPKASPLQPTFSGGEFSPRAYARTDSERYKSGMATCLNYLPTTQGPLIRRPGTRYVGNDVKDPSKPPNLIEFKFSQKQNYILEFGDLYIRFYANNGQITTTSTHFKVSGNYGTVNASFASSNFYAMRSSPFSNAGETILASSVVLASSVLEIQSPYSYPDIFDLKISQKSDTLFIVHSSYPEYALQRFGNELWDIKRVNHIDGPYLAFNTYRYPGDSSRVTIVAGTPAIIYQDGSSDYEATTGPVRVCSSITNNGAGLIRVNIVKHGFVTGDRVVVRGVAGTTEANNGTSSIAAMFWPVNKIDDNNFDLLGSAFVNGYVGSGLVYPALFEPYGSNTAFNDVNRVIGLVRTDGGRAWGRIVAVRDMSRIAFHLDSATSGLVTGSSANQIVTFWQLGIWNRSNGYANSICFHQDRKFLGGPPQYPQTFQASVSGDYNNFQGSNSSFIVSDNNALDFGLNADQLNSIFWMKSDSQGLLAGSFQSEWNITPSSQGAALTPTNVDARQTSYFGSANADAVQAGNATLYIQRANRKIRELNYFFQVNTYRSTDLAELSEHITNPAVQKLSVQKETVPVVWGLRTDGQLISMVYSRDDVSLKAGWARHQLGGQSDSGNSAPLVKSMAVIPSPDGSFDQMWCTVQRFINGTSAVTVEYMTKPFDEQTAQEDSVHFDCSAAYDSPIAITSITTGSAVITAANHGFAVGDMVKINSVSGLNSSSVDSYGVIFNSNLVNGNVFLVASTATNTFLLRDFNSSFVKTLGYSAYISGGSARKLVTTISGLTWLKNETVSVLADGKNHPQVIVNSAGVITLSYPAAKVQIGYPYNSDGKALRPEAGSADGTAMGKIRSVARAAFMVNNVGDLQIGASFSNLTPQEFNYADVIPADTAPPLFSGILRESISDDYDFDGQVCWRQNSGLPGMIQSLTVIVEEQDV